MAGDPPHIPPAHFGALTPLYDAMMEAFGFGWAFREAVIGELALAGTERLLDAGCGTGSLLADLRARYPALALAGADPDAAALAIARRKVALASRVRLEQAPMDRLPFEDASFDVVVSTLAFHHIFAERKAASLAECGRVLGPGGRILLVDLGPDGAGPLSRAALRLVGLFEPVGDNARVPSLLAAAGFGQVRLARRFGLAAFHEAWLPREP